MGSGIAPSEWPVYLGRCLHCGEKIYEHEGHYDVPGEGFFCSWDCLYDYMKDYWVAGLVE